jgi:putative hydrolase of the HAD superfamily
MDPIATGEVSRLPDLSSVQVAFFDVYGTLLISGVGDISTLEGSETGDLSAQAWTEWFGNHPAPKESLRDTIQRFQRLERLRGADYPEVNLREVWDDRLSAAGLKLSPEERDAWAIYHECRVNPVWAMPGARAALDRLRARGVKLGIISNAQFFTPLLLEHCLGASLEELGFDERLLVWSYRIKRGKPSGSLFAQAEREACAEKYEPHEILMIGNDLQNDVANPFYMGWRTLLFAGDQRSLRWRKEVNGMKGVRADGMLAAWEDLA